MGNYVRDLFCAWRFYVISHSLQKQWDITVIAIIWQLWLERNGRVFTEHSVPVEGLVRKVQYHFGFGSLLVLGANCMYFPSPSPVHFSPLPSR